MGGISQRRRTAAVVVLLVCASATSARQRASDRQGAGETLFGQSVAEALNRDFSDKNISFLLLDARSAKPLASRWEDAAIPMGSLVKPFTALAYGEQHGYKYPSHVCRGTACWRPRGHGNVTLSLAIAYSCNSYFRMLAANLRAKDVSRTAAEFGIEAPEASASADTFAGLGEHWRISPARIARAYAELATRRDQAGVRDIVAGLALSASMGTGSAVGRAVPYEDALVKTGTAPCTHRARAPGDGLAVGVWPGEAPRFVLLVRVHGRPGAVAAVTAGEMLRRIAE
jgi:cell division protein FtsI/penicillin-binding protein 2